MTATVEHVKGDRGDRTGNAEFARQQAEGHVCEVRS